MINVQMVDDHKVVIESIGKVINDSGIAKVTNIYFTLRSCREGLAKQLPDILFLDIRMPVPATEIRVNEIPDDDGIKFCAEMTKTYPGLKVIMLTYHRDFNIVKHAMANGALGYILKNANSAEMFAGIEAVNRGEKFLCEEIDILMKDRPGTNAVWLTNTEINILKKCAEGLTQRQIAIDTCRNQETIKSHLKNIRVKLGAKNTAQAVSEGYALNLL